MNDRTTRFGTFTCTHRSKHWIKAIATHPPPIHHTTPHHTTPHPLLAHPGQNLCVSNPGGWPIALHAAKAIVTMLKVVFTFRYVTRTPAITGNPRIRSNPEPVRSPPPSTPFHFANYSVCSGEGAYIKTFVPRLIVRIRIEISTSIDFLSNLALIMK